MNNEVKNVLKRHWLSRFYDFKLRNTQKKNRKQRSYREESKAKDSKQETRNEELIKLVNGF